MLLVLGALSLGGVVVLKNAQASESDFGTTADSLGGKDGGGGWVTLGGKDGGSHIELGGKDGGGHIELGGKDGGSHIELGGKDGGSHIELSTGGGK
jgi:hypothetical protein